MVIARLQLGGVRRAVSKLAAESAAAAPCRQLEVKPGESQAIGCSTRALDARTDICPGG